MGLKSAKHTPNPKHINVLKGWNLQPGDQVSTDQFECRLKGRLAYARGKEDPQIMLRGGLIFADYVSEYVRVFNQVSLGAADTIIGKESYKYQATEVGVTVKQYHGDNGVCKSKCSTVNLDKRHQTMTRSC